MMTKLKAFLEEEVSKGSFPGAGYAIVQGGKITLEDFVGFKSYYPKKIKNKGNEIYDIASLTKVVSTTTLIMKLIEQKKLGYDYTVQQILPRFKHDQITIYHLLTHTSGLPADISHAKTLKSLEEVQSIVYQMDLINPVGEQIVYSDIGFIILGWVIEQITQTKLDIYAKKMIFDPLEMNDTGYHPNKSRSAPTEYRDDLVFKGYLKGQVHDEKSFAMGGVSGHAGLFSTPHDLAKFITYLLNKDTRLLNEKSIDDLFLVNEERVSKTGVKLIRSLGWDKPSFGGSAGNVFDFENTIVHTGFTGCNMVIDRKRMSGFVLLSNAIHPSRELNHIPSIRNKIGNMINQNEGD